MPKSAQDAVFSSRGAINAFLSLKVNLTSSGTQQKCQPRWLIHSFITTVLARSQLEQQIRDDRAVSHGSKTQPSDEITDWFCFLQQENMTPELIPVSWRCQPCPKYNLSFSFPYRVIKGKEKEHKSDP